MAEFWIVRWTGTTRRNPRVGSPALTPLEIGYLTLLCLDIRPYMYETLMTLVGVHAQVCNVAEPLLDRTLNGLVEELASEALRCFRQVKRFGMGGMLRV